METNTMQGPRGRGAGRARLPWARMLAGVVACGGGSSAGSTPPVDTVAASTVRVHYKRVDGVYTNWAVYSWNGPTTRASSSARPMASAPTSTSLSTRARASWTFC